MNNIEHNQDVTKDAEGQSRLNAGLGARTCDTCKHWGKADKYETGHGLNLGRCQNIPMFWGATEWNEEGDGRKFLEKYKDTKAFAQDGSDYKAYLLTRADFGCVSHEAPNV